MELQDVLTALQNAHAAGDTQAARELAQLAKSMQETSAQDRLREFRRQQAEARRTPAPEPEVETTFGGNVKEAFKGLVPGAIGLAETAGTGIAALLPEDTEKAAREKIREIAGMAKKPFEAAKGYEESVGRKLGEGLGSTLPFFALGPAGLAGRAAASGLGVAAGAGEAREAAEAKGATAEERRAATLLGAPTGLLDILAPNIGPMKSIITTALARGGIEGATEAAQKIAQNLIAKGVYDPSQSVLAGSGEEGAYGAGVGAMASVILDLTLGRKARQAKFGEKPEAPPTTPESKPTEQQLLGYTPEPFTPVALPDGSVITTKAEYDEYIKGKNRTADERAEDRRTSDPLAGLTEGQRDLARRGKEAALTETFQSQEPDLFGEIVPKREDVTTEGVEQPSTNRDERTRDMIDELETADIEKMVAEDESAKLRELIKERDKAIAETDKRVADAQKTRSTNERMALLEPLVKADIPNLQEVFVQKLERAGFTDTQPTEAEAKVIEAETRRAKINSLIDRYFAIKPKAEESAVEPSAPAENAEMEALIPEKKTEREPEQIGFPGMGKPKGKAPQAFSEEELAAQAAQDEKPFATTLTAEVLDQTGLPKQSGFYKQLLNIDMTDKANWPVMREVFGRVRTNPNVKPATKQAIERIAMQAFGGMAKQQELFPPETKGAKKPAKEKPSDGARGRGKDTGTDAGATGTRTEDRKSGVQKPAATERPAGTKPTEESKPAGLGDRGQSVRDAGDRKGVESGALKETKVHPRMAARIDAIEEQEEAQEQAEYATQRAKMVSEFKAKHDRDIKGAWAEVQRARQAVKNATPKSKIDYMSIGPAISRIEDVLSRYDRAVNVEADSIQRRDLETLEKMTLSDLPALRKELADALNYQPKAKPAPKAETKVEAKAEPKAAPKAEGKTEPQPKKAEFGYYGQTAVADPDMALKSLAYDMYIAMFEKFKLLTRTDLLNDIAAQLREGKMPEVAFGREGTTSINPASGGKYAKAFYESLSGADRTAMMKHMYSYFTTGESEVRRGTDAFNAKQVLDREIKKQMDEDLELTADMVRSFMPLHPSVEAALKGGKLVDALNLFGGALTSRNAKIARALAKVLGGVKVEVVNDLKSPSGRSLAGSYDATTNTIKLDSKNGMNPHALLHEATHAAVAKILGNKAHPATKQLTELFNTVKGSLDTMYGATSLDEFVSEVFSNPDFQRKLAEINPKGEPISALRRFTNAVGNFLRTLVGMPTKGLNSALDSADVAIMQIIAPGASMAGSLHQASMLGTATDVFKALDDTILSMPGMNTQFVGGIYSVLRQKIPDATKNIILRSLPLNALTDVAVEQIPMAKQLDTLEKKWNGAIDERRRAVDATYNRISKWTKGNPEKEAALNKLVMKSTLEEVDPSKPVETYKGKTTKSGKDKQAVWKEMQPEWQALEAEGQSIYNQMRDSYAETHEKLLDLLFNRISASAKDPESVKKLRDEIYQRLAVKGKIEPYFPLMRQGDYWVTFNAKGPDGQLEYYKMAFQNSVQRDLAMKQLKADPNVDAKSVQKSSPTAKRSYKDAPPTSFVNNVLKVLNANQVDPTVTDEIMRVFLDTLPESSFAQSFRARMGTLGAETNASAVFYSKSISMAHQLANLEYSAKMYALRDEMQEHVDTKNKSEEARMLFNTLDRHIQTMVSPDISPLAKIATSTAFGWTLGFNISSAVVNTTQLPMVVMPYLGGKYGFGEANRALGAATRLFFQSGRKRKAKTTGGGDPVELKAGYSIDNYDFEALAKKKNLTADEKAILELRELSDLSSEYGLLSRSMTSDVLETSKADGPMARINAWSGFIFHHGERMNRQVSMIAAYRLELDRMKKESGKELTPEQRTEAARNAINTTELLNGGASANSAPLLAKNSIGKMVFMYKRYGVSMYYMLFKTTRDALHAEDPEVRKAAKRQIAGVYATSALLAGVQGIPMFGVAAALYNLFAKEDDEDDFETAARKYMGEGMFNGALNYLTGTAVANRIGLTDLLFHSTGYRDQDNAVLSFLQLVGGPVYGVADRVTRGVKLIFDGETQRGLEQVMPAGFSNVAKAGRFLTEGANTMRGDPIIGEVGTGHVLAQALGFAPAEYMRQMEENAALKNIERRTLEKRTELLRKFYVSTRLGDGDEAAKYMEELMELGRKHPGLVTADTIINSMRQHMRTTGSMYHGVTLNKLMRGELMQNASEYDRDVSIFSDDGE